MSKPPRESEEAKEILTVRIGARMSDRIEAVAEEADTKSEGYREVLELGLIAYEHDRAPGELETELGKSIWERVPHEIKLILGSALFAVIGVVPIVLQFFARELFGYSVPPTGPVPDVIGTGLLIALLATLIFILSVLYLIVNEVIKAIAPGAA